MTGSKLVYLSSGINSETLSDFGIHLIPSAYENAYLGNP